MKRSNGKELLGEKKIKQQPTELLRSWAIIPQVLEMKIIGIEGENGLLYFWCDILSNYKKIIEVIGQIFLTKTHKVGKEFDNTWTQKH